MAFEQEIDVVKEVQDKAVERLRRKPKEPNFELGPWDYPITEFISRFQQLKRNSPQYTDEEAASITYFGMVAQQPTPTADFTDISIDWDKVDSLAYDKSIPDAFYVGPNWTLVELELLIMDHLVIGSGNISDYIGMKKNKNGKWQIYFFGANVRTTRSITDSYVASVYHLNRYLVYNGLYDGVRKTLAEESRRLQGLRAQALASQQAAAKALALSKASENVSEEAIDRYEKQLEEARVKEAEITDYLQKLSRTPEGQGSTSSSGVSGIIPLAIGAAVAALALR